MTTKTHVTFVLDSSGSMAAIEDDTRGGFNVFLEEQREEDGEATVTLYNFDTNVELVYRMAPIEEADTLDTENYRPGGGRHCTMRWLPLSTRRPRVSRGSRKPIDRRT